MYRNTLLTQRSSCEAHQLFLIFLKFHVFQTTHKRKSIGIVRRTKLLEKNNFCTHKKKTVSKNIDICSAGSRRLRGLCCRWVTHCKLLHTHKASNRRFCLQILLKLIWGFNSLSSTSMNSWAWVNVHPNSFIGVRHDATVASIPALFCVVVHVLCIQMTVQTINIVSKILSS